MADIRISQLPTAGAITGTELVPIVQNGQTVQTTTGAISASPSQTQTFLTVTQEATLPNSRYFGVGLGLGYSDAGIQGLYQIYLDGTSASLENASTGIIVKSGVDTITPRQIAVSGNGLSIANGNGISGNPTIALDALPASLASLSGNGILAINSGSSIVARTLTGTASQISITNATGTANPTFSIADNPILGGTEGLVVPRGTNGERPLGTNGLIRYNTTSARFEVYANDDWQTLGEGDGTVTQVSGTANQITVADGTTTPTVSIATNAVLPGTGAVKVPTGTTAQRGGVTPANGMMRYNTDTQQFEGYLNGTWTAFAAGSGVTSISAGTGLTGGTITSTGTIGIDSSVVTLTGAQTLTFKTISGSDNTLSNIANASLTNSSVTINGTSVSLGASATITASNPNALTIGTGLSGTSYNGSSAVTIAISSTGVSASTYGSASAVPVFTVNAQGQITSVTNTNIAISNSAVSGLGSAALLTAGSANGVATLDSGGTVPLSQIPSSLIGTVSYQGTWNASTNTPTLASGVGTKGYYYVVSVAGTTNLDGIASWAVGDWAIYSGTAWQKIDNTDAVSSVNGYTGTVVLTYTDVGAQPAGTYVTAVSGTSPIASSGGTTPAISISQATTSTNGYLSSTDWNTFNGKAGAGANSDITSMSGLTGGIATPQYIDFDTTNSVSRATGRLWWDGSDGIQTLNLGMAGSNATMQIGEEIYYRIKCSSAITEGQVVMFTGTVGASGGLTGAPATGLTASTASYIMGVATESGALNDWIYVTQFGLVRGIDTTGGAEAWVDGQILYYDPTVAGGLTKTAPSAPNAKVQVCSVVYANANGSLFIRPTFGGALGQFEGDVQITSATTNDLLVYNTNKWVNTASSSVTVGTATNATNVAVTTGSATTNYLAFVTATTGNLPVLTNTGLTYNSSTNAITGGIAGGTF